MRWLLAEMWVYLAVAFVAGMLAYRWIFGGGVHGAAAEDASAELASVRTRHQEAEAERARLRSKVVELNHQLEDARRAARSAQAEAHAARLEAAATVAAVQAAAPAASFVEAKAQGGEASSSAAQEIVAAPDEGAASTPPAERPISFMEMLRDGGAPDDLTRIKGIGRKLEAKLNGLGVYYYRQIAAWTDAEVAEMDKHLGFPGRIVRDQWREQARALGGAERGTPAP